MQQIKVIMKLGKLLFKCCLIINLLTLRGLSLEDQVGANHKNTKLVFIS